MLRLLSIITIKIIILRVKSYESCDDKYCLSTSGTPETVINLENARGKCENSWILEIYDETVITLLNNLNVNTQKNGILLGMEQSARGWMWSDGTKFSGNIYNLEEANRVVAYITNNNNYISYSALTIFDSVGIICSKVTTKDNCAGWFHNGLCYFKPITTTYNWFQAHNVCIKNGATMAMFNNSETNFNKTFIDNQTYWVSLSRSTWMWTHADEAVTFNQWSSGQPDTIYKECATTTSNGNEWKSVECSGTYNIVCMKENHESITQSPLLTPGINNITTQSPLSTPGINNITTQSPLPTPGINNITTQSPLPTPGINNITTQSPLPTPGINNITTQSPLSTPGFNNITTQSPPPAPGINVITTSLKYSPFEESLSSGAKAGIGVGVSLLVVLIVLIGVLVFKYFHQLKMKFGRKNSRKPLESENHYAEIVSGNNKSVSTNDIPGSINYADLDLQSQGTLSNNNLIQ